MEFRAHLSYLRIAPRKVRLLAQALVGMRASAALARLTVTPKRSVDPLAKLIGSAVANASKSDRKADQLTIKSLRVNEGPKLKRYRPRAFGRAAVILKRSSHVTLILDDRETAAKPRSAKTPKEKAPKKTMKNPPTAQPASNA
jgi:large subunit ribosomal protein L22